MTGFNSVQQLESDSYEGYYVATVVDNNDPKKLQRVRVNIPELMEGASALLPWIAPIQKAVFGFGNTSGTVSVPEVGSQVVVQFQEGDLSYGLMLGAIPSKVFELPGELSTNYPKRYGWKDPAGNVFYVDTTSGSNDVEFKHVSGTTIHINNAGEVTVTAPKATVNATGEVDLNTPLTKISQNLQVGGNVVVTGTVQATDLLMPGGRTFMNHRHDDILIGVPGNPPLPGF